MLCDLAMSRAGGSEIEPRNFRPLDGRAIVRSASVSMLAVARPALQSRYAALSIHADQPPSAPPGNGKRHLVPCPSRALQESSGSTAVDLAMHGGLATLRRLVCSIMHGK